MIIHINKNNVLKRLILAYYFFRKKVTLKFG